MGQVQGTRAMVGEAMMTLERVDVTVETVDVTVETVDVGKFTSVENMNAGRFLNFLIIPIIPTAFVGNYVKITLKDGVYIMSNEGSAFWAGFGVCVIIATILLGVLWLPLQRTETLQIWIGAEEQGSVVIYEGRVITPENIKVFFPDDES